jgi:glycosyltransferase involved in cell wall biosynthesis
MQTMRQTIESASGVVANTPEAARRITEVCRQLPPSRLAVVPNGYDAQDFRVAAELDAGSEDALTREFRIVHSGTLHGDSLYQPHLRATVRRLLEYSPERIDPLGRTIAPLLAAVKILRQRGHGSPPIRIVLVGPQDEGTRRCIAESGVQDAVTCTGFVTHIESIRWLLRADALFLPLHDLPDGSRSLIVPGKTYEYLATGKPILAAVPQGDARDLVSAARFGYPCAPTNERDIAATLQRLMSDWRGGRLTPNDPLPWVARYARRQLCAKLDQFLSQVAESSQKVSGVVDRQRHRAVSFDTLRDEPASRRSAEILSQARLARGREPAVVWSDKQPSR